MSVSKERLSMIGKMIGIYREERRENTQNCWTQKRFCKDICSTNTLKNIEKGELSRAIDVYTELLAKLDLKLDEFPAIDMAIMKLTDELYHAIEYYSDESINKVTAKVIRVLAEVKEYAYYSEMYELFCNIRNYYMADSFISNEQVDKYIQIMYVLPNELMDFYRILIYAKMKTSGIGSMDRYNEFVEAISLDKCHNNVVKINLLDCFYITDRYIKMKDLINELERYFIEKNNFVRVFDIYNFAIVLLSRIEFPLSEIFIEKSKNMLEKHRIPNVKMGELFSNIARAYHINSKYELALQYYSEMAQIDRQDYIDCLMFMADCQNHLGLEVHIPMVEDECFKQYPVDVKLMYKYFTLDSSIPAFAKENYILKKIAPHLMDNNYIEIFRFELMKIVNDTNHYKSIHSFESIVKDNTKA